jgi:hypothetical protein
MNDNIGASDQHGGSIVSPSDKNQELQPSAVDYVVRVSPVDNPLGLKELEHQRIQHVWKVMVDQDGDIVQVMGLVSTTLIDTRYLVN